MVVNERRTPKLCRAPRTTRHTHQYSQVWHCVERLADAWGMEQSSSRDLMVPVMNRDSNGAVHMLMLSQVHPTDAAHPTGGWCGPTLGSRSLLPPASPPHGPCGYHLHPRAASLQGLLEPQQARRIISAAMVPHLAGPCS